MLAGLFRLLLLFLIGKCKLTESVGLGITSDSELYICENADITSGSEFSEHEKGEIRQWQVPGSLMAFGEPTNFSLMPAPADWNCGGGHKTFSHSLEADTNSNSGQNSSGPGSGAGFQFYRDGYAQIGSGPDSDYFPPAQYCIQKLSASSVQLQICSRACTRQQPCIRKCCPMTKLFAPALPLCRPQPQSDTRMWQPTFYTNIYDQSTRTQVRMSSAGSSGFQPSFYVRLWSSDEWKASCASGQTEIKFNRFRRPRERFRVGTNGEVGVWSAEKRQWELDSGPHCIDEMLDGSAAVLIFCEAPYVQRGAPTFYGTLVLCTSFFALATLVVHFLLWEKQNIHSWTIMSFAGTLFVFFVVLGVSQLVSYRQEFLGTTACKVMGTLGHFFALATFTWLMIISLDLYLTFRDIMVTKSRGIKRYLLYSCLGWGIPLLIVTTAWSLELGYGSDNYSTVKVPHYGRLNCYVTQYAMTQYVYGPCTALYVVNIMFFVLTLRKLLEVKRSTRFARADTKKDRQSFYLFVKLFFVIGVLWFLEFAGWFLEHGHATWYWMLLDFSNCLQPVSLFVIFILKVDVLKSLAEKYPSLSPVTTPLISMLKSLDESFGCGPRKRGTGAQSEMSSSSKSEKSTFSTETTDCDTEF